MNIGSRCVYVTMQIDIFIVALKTTLGKLLSFSKKRSSGKLLRNLCLRDLVTYNNDPDVFNIFRSKELAKILRRTLLM